MFFGFEPGKTANPPTVLATHYPGARARLLLTREKELFITTPACNLVGLIREPLTVQRKDASRYTEGDIGFLDQLIEADCVEGVVRKNGTIKHLRMTVELEEAITRIAALASKHAETPGSVISGASQTVFHEHLPSGAMCWQLKRLHDGWNRTAVHRFMTA